MHREWIGILMVSACVGAPLCTAAESIAKSLTVTAEVLDEVLIRGVRLRELEAAIVVAEDHFYARYNELNKVDDFDIECRVEAPLGTKIPQRLCLTKLQLTAKADLGREYLQSLQEMTKFGTEGTGKRPNTNPIAVWASRYDQYRDNMLTLLQMNPDLRRLAEEGEEARKRFEAEYKRRLKGRLILLE